MRQHFLQGYYDVENDTEGEFFKYFVISLHIYVYLADQEPGKLYRILQERERICRLILP